MCGPMCAGHSTGLCLACGDRLVGKRWHPVTWEARRSRQDLSLGWGKMRKAEFGSGSLKRRQLPREARENSPCSPTRSLLEGFAQRQAWVCKCLPAGRRRCPVSGGVLVPGKPAVSQRSPPVRGVAGLRGAPITRQAEREPSGAPEGQHAPPAGRGPGRGPRTAPSSRAAERAPLKLRWAAYRSSLE